MQPSSKSAFPLPPDLPKLTGRDLRIAAFLRLAAAVDRLGGPSGTKRAARILAKLNTWIKPSQAQFRRERVTAVSAAADFKWKDTADQDVACAIVAARFEEAALLARMQRLPDWTPPLQFEGAEHLKNRKNGAAVWVVTNRGAMLATAMCLHHCGVLAHRLSKWDHGPASPDRLSLWGAQNLNRPWQLVEDRYATRIVIAPESASNALEKVHKVVDAGGVVLINAVNEGKRPVRVETKGGTYSVAVGAIWRAYQAGAEIFCASVTQTPAGRRVDIAPLAKPASLASPEDLVARMAPVAVATLLDSPGLWAASSDQLIPPDAMAPRKGTAAP